jgi:hypothetical protein
VLSDTRSGEPPAVSERLRSQFAARAIDGLPNPHGLISSAVGCASSTSRG